MFCVQYVKFSDVASFSVWFSCLFIYPAIGSIIGLHLYAGQLFCTSSIAPSKKGT